MIIANQNTPTPAATGAADVRSGAARTSPPDAADASTDPSVAVGEAFGQLLARRMDGGGTTDLPKVDPKDASPDGGEAALGADGRPLATTNARPTVDPDVAATIADGAALPGPAAVKSGLPGGDAATTKPVPAKDDEPAGNDLAAQLALVSQWAALPPTTTAKATGSAPGGKSADALDVKGKLATVREMSTKPTTQPATPPVTIDEARATLLPALATTAPPTGDRTVRGASTTTAAVTKAVDLKAKVDAQATAAGDRLSLAEAILGKVEPVAAQGPNDAASLTSAFASQVNAQVAAQVSSAQTAVAATAASTLSQLHEAVGTPAWSHEVGQATLRMAANDLQGASLRLNPEHLGPLDVQVRIDNGVAHLAFNAAHAETRQALESSRTTLDQLFADQGLKIGDCAVGDSSKQQRFDANSTQDGAQRDGNRWGSARDGANDAATSTVTTTVRRALGLVDTFA